MTAELTRLVALSKIGRAGFSVMVRATPEECASVATRMDLPAVQSLECSFTLTAEADGVSIAARGRLQAQVTRVCVVSAEDFETVVEDEFALRFVPAGTERDDPDPDLPDEVPYQFETIDLGEATAEQLGLALDPYPRIEGAVVPGSDDNESTSPFAALARRSGSEPGPDKTRH
jgi:uncharacterized metal-binding protein YceD (DUF177 family)